MLEHVNFPVLVEMDIYLHQKILGENKKWLTPELGFPSDCIVQFTPTTLAQTRFMIWKKSKPDNKISVYLDCFDALGPVGEPYWEIYGLEHPDGGPWRFLLQEGERLMNKINELLGE